MITTNESFKVSKITFVTFYVMNIVAIIYISGMPICAILAMTGMLTHGLFMLWQQREMFKNIIINAYVNKLLLGYNSVA